MDKNDLAALLIDAPAAEVDQIHRLLHEWSVGPDSSFPVQMSERSYSRKSASALPLMILPIAHHLRTQAHHVAYSDPTQQTVEMWSFPDFSQLTAHRYEQVFIGNSADLAYVPAPAPEGGKEIPVDPRQRISKISEPLAPMDFVHRKFVCTRVG
jgi:hypothetical protein